jgi:long-chain acyl-CoA synthetase
VATEAAAEQTPPRHAPAGRTIGALWARALEDERDFPAYLVETEAGWAEVSWSEAASAVDEIAHGLLALGIAKGDAVGILSATRLEWVLVDFALARIGAITAPIYASSSAADCAYLLELTEAVAVFVEDGEQSAKIEAARESAPRLTHVLRLDRLDDLRARGRAHREQSPDAVARAEAAIGDDDLFTYIFTSGTTGPPKACMIRHRNYFAMAATVDLLDEFTVRRDLMLLYLPLAHNFGRLLHLLGAYAGYTIAFLPDPLRTADVLPAVRPTVLPSVPRLYEKVHTRIQAQFDAATGLRRRLIEWALSTGYEASPYRCRGEPQPARHRLADRLVYSKVKERLGGRLRLGISGGAPLSREIAEFFHALDILILEGYGLSECTTACSVNLPGRVRFGSVGQLLPGFEVRVAEDGELLIRSETVFAGYYRDEESTRAVLDADGWLHSGDVGALDDDGYLWITDRKKDIIVTAGGKNVAPQNLENALKASKLVSQALVIGDRRPYLVALISLDDTEAAGLSSSDARDAVQALVDSVNAGRASFEQVKRFVIVPRDFSIEEGEVTATLKLRRRAVARNFSEEIEALYAGLAPTSP